MKYIVTIKEYQKGHNPRDKKSGKCITSEYCTDNTGHHHSIVVEVPEIHSSGLIQDLVNEFYEKEIYITRIEEMKTIEFEFGENNENR